MLQGLKMIVFIKKNIIIWLIASFTLGLAPFTPEPHLFGKINWLIGGAKGMELMDWFDLILHGAPWLLLLLSVAFNLIPKK